MRMLEVITEDLFISESTYLSQKHSQLSSFYCITFPQVFSAVQCQEEVLSLYIIYKITNMMVNKSKSHRQTNLTVTLHCPWLAGREAEAVIFFPAIT